MKSRKPQLLGVAQARHQQRAGAVGALVVHRQPQSHVRMPHYPRLAVGAVMERGVHLRVVIGDRPHHGVGDEVGVG